MRREGVLMKCLQISDNSQEEALTTPEYSQENGPCQLGEFVNIILLIAATSEAEINNQPGSATQNATSASGSDISPASGFK